MAGSNEYLDFEDVKVQSKYREKYKGIPGEKHRIGIIWPKEIEGKKKGPFETKMTHYHEKYFVCKEGMCCEKLGPPTQRFACLVIKYKTEKDGKLIKDAATNGLPFKFEVLPWLFSATKFNALKDLHREWNLKERDIIVTCKGTEQYQDLDFTPAKESLWQLDPKFREEIYKVSEPIVPLLSNELGADLTADEIKELLTGAGEQVSVDSVVNTSSDINDILNSV